MNIYLITETDEEYCIKAETMNDAISISKDRFLDAKEVETGEDNYFKTIFKRIKVIGRLIN